MKNYFGRVNEARKKDIKFLDLLWFIGIPVLNINYFLASKIAKNGYDLTTPLDKIITFRPMFIFPYLYWYLYIVIGLILILLQDRKDYIRAFLSIFIGMCICYLVYYIFPTEINRPLITDKSLMYKLINFIYSMDRPFNCFPSLHVLTTYFIMRYTKREEFRLVFYYTQIVGTLIVLSTVFIKQHFFVDIFVSIILCEAIIIVIKKVDDNILDDVLDIPYKMKKSIFKNSILFKD